MDWKPILDFPDYEVSENGSVRRLTPGRNTYPGRLLKNQKHQQGYARVCLPNREGFIKTVEVHRLVAYAFLGDPPTPDHEVAHYDGDPQNNHYDNLRWATKQENKNDSIRHGTVIRGEDCWQARLNIEDVKKIRRARNEGRLLRDLADDFGVSVNHIGRIVNYTAWRHVQ